MFDFPRRPGVVDFVHLLYDADDLGQDLKAVPFQSGLNFRRLFKRHLFLRSAVRFLDSLERTFPSLRAELRRLGARHAV